MVKVPVFVMYAFAAFVVPNIASADLVFNGGFETGDFTGWILSGNPIPGTVDNLNPHSGLFAADLIAAGSPSFMEQLLATTPGLTYNLTYFLDVSFSFASPPEAANGTPVEFLAQVNGLTVFDESNIPPQPYTRYSFPFLATGTSTDLKFGFRNDAGAFFLDDISVTATPEPGSLWLGLLVTTSAIIAGRCRQSRGEKVRS
ncbi:MAG: hypothetical protein JO210_11135 [Acidobacteriaceae bacterium]|nr:hypothetical protein [Acidobacteriaceae bacterium]